MSNGEEFTHLTENKVHIVEICKKNLNKLEN